MRAEFFKGKVMQIGPTQSGVLKIDPWPPLCYKDNLIKLSILLPLRPSDVSCSAAVAFVLRSDGVGDTNATYVIQHFITYRFANDSFCTSFCYECVFNMTATACQLVLIQ